MKLISTLAVAVLAGIACSQDRMLVQAPQGTVQGKAYTGVHALLIGINRYEGLPRGLQLSHAVNDAADLAKELKVDYGFKDVTLLTDKEATLSAIRSALASFADNRRIQPDDMVLVYFSGHGQTVPIASGGAMGFLIPSDAKVDLDNPTNSAPYLESCLPMKQVWDYLDLSPAKHAVVIADACFSGLMARSRGGSGLNKAALEVMLARRARQVIAAGSSGQKTTERDDLGHGVFTAKLLEELKARATVKDRAFTISDLFASLQEQVSNATNGKQTPQMGNFDSEGEAVLFPSSAAAKNPEPPVKEPPVKEPPVKEPPKKEPPVKQPPVKEPPKGEPAAAGKVPAGLNKRQGEFYLKLQQILQEGENRFAGVPHKTHKVDKLVGPNEATLYDLQTLLTGFTYGGVTDKDAYDSIVYFEGAPTQGKQVFADYKAAIKALMPEGREQNFDETNWRIMDDHFQITLRRELEDTWRVEQVYQKMWLTIVKRR